ncbi:MAG: AmmeMemoRadiSam system radical SAM enzyme [Methanolobus sp.]|nr:AmmeMemoRadiSam system radical SAM enzyme [Methanolobus sp.]
MIREAMLYDRLEDGKVQCKLCAHRCRILTGKQGFCRVRENREGILYTLNYNVVSSEALDPIEKKPLFHFYPGSLVYSLGTIGCNFRCKHCQNWTISQIGMDEANAIEMSAQMAVQRAVASGARAIAWTYNEPTIWFEYTYECARLAKEAGLATVYVTNGYITREGLEMIAPYLDAFRVDIKAFTDGFYREIASAKLAPVLESAKLAREIGMHVEVVNLVIPTLNDSMEEIKEMTVWIRENLGEDTPVHFTRFHPYYKLQDIPATPLETLENAYNIAKDAGLRYVYLGNVPGTGHEDTFCPECGELIIKRGAFSIEVNRLTDEQRCPRCGEHISVISGQ